MRSNLSEKEKVQRGELIRSALPACQPQEGSPANSFTPSEIKQLRTAVKGMTLGPQVGEDLYPIDAADQIKLLKQKHETSQKMDILNPNQWSEPTESQHQEEAHPQEQHLTTSNNIHEHEETINCSWHGAPKILETPAQMFRQKVRKGFFESPTNGQCPGFMQCNLVVLPQGPIAFDFLLFCQRNKKACPLIEVCDVGSPHPVGVARGADLRTDIPKYAIYKDGVLHKEVSDVTEYWPEQSVAFLIGCSFTYDGAFLDAGIPLRSAELGRNVPMYRTNLPCRTSGSLSGNMVVSMKPIPAIDIAKEVEITSQYPHAHGGPVCVGNPKSIGIENIDKPDWGDSIQIRDDEVPVFHACGVTPQNVLMDSKVPFAITHSPGYMFITDLPCDCDI